MSGADGLRNAGENFLGAVCWKIYGDFCSGKVGGGFRGVWGARYVGVGGLGFLCEQGWV